jgi:hypothetical protein
MPVLTKRREYCVGKFKHTIIPVVDSLFIGHSVAEAFLKAFNIDTHRTNANNIVSQKVAIKERPTELHFVFLKNIGQIPTGVKRVFDERKIMQTEKVGVILQGSKSAANMLKSMAESIDKSTGAHVCVW